MSHPGSKTTITYAGLDGPQAGAPGRETLATLADNARPPARGPASVDGAASMDSATIYVRLAAFGDGVAEELRRAAADVGSGRSADDDVADYVVDVRGNPGGFLDEAADVASFFLPPSTRVATVAGRGSVAAVETSPPREALRPRPRRVAVLVDRETRSAAEIFAAALKTSESGVVVGETTFGKGSAQNVIPLKSDPKSGLRLTTATVAVGADGRTRLDGVGVTPDAPVAGSDDALVELLIAKGAFFDFASSYAEAHPKLADDAVETSLRENLGATWRAFLSGAPLAVDDALDERYDPDVRDAANAAATKALARSLRRLSTNRRCLDLAAAAVRARHAPTTGRDGGRLPRLADDDALRTAKRLLDDDAAFRNAKDHLRSETARRPPPTAEPPVVGFDPDADCLPLQICNTRKYVYLLLP